MVLIMTDVRNKWTVLSTKETFASCENSIEMFAESNFDNWETKQ